MMTLYETLVSAVLSSTTAASIYGLALGVVVALLAGAIGLLRRPPSGVAEGLHGSLTSPGVAKRSTRQERAAQLLAQLTSPSTGTSAAGCDGAGELPLAGSSRPSAPRYEQDGSEEDNWDTEEDEEDEEDDSDVDMDVYERAEELRLKMVLVVRQFKPKMEPHLVASLTAGAGVGLIEWLNALPSPTDEQVPPRMASDEEFTAHNCLPTYSAEEARKWQQWYGWWNTVGCGKIALKAPDSATMDTVLAEATLRRLPVYVTRLSHSRVGTEEAGSREVGSGAGADDLVVVAIGPVPADEVDPVSGQLKLFS